MLISKLSGAIAIGFVAFEFGAECSTFLARIGELHPAPQSAAVRGHSLSHAEFPFVATAAQHESLAPCMGRQCGCDLAVSRHECVQELQLCSAAKPTNSRRCAA